MSSLVIIYSTTPTKSEAQFIARTLLEEKRIACANIIGGAQSLYIWQGEICEAEEAVMLMKTVDSQAASVMARIKELHSYECPCILVLSPEQADTLFQKWVETSVHA